ncbi:unnamed protein product [Sphagnum compactum]
MADVSLAVLRGRELLEEVMVASEIRVIQAVMALLFVIQCAEHVNSKCVICTIPSILEVILHNTKRQRSRSELTRFCPAAPMMLFTQHFQDKEYVSALWKFVLRRLALASFHNSLPSVLNPQISLLEYMKSMRGLQWFRWVGFGCILLGLD